MMNSISRVTLIVVVILFATLAAPVVGQPERGIVVGQGIEPRQARTIEREKVRLPAEEGLTVLLFWSTWSPRSSSAIEIWQDYAVQYRDHNMTVYSINADNQRMEPADIQKVKDYIARNEVTLPVIIDEGLELFNEIGVIVLPTTLIFKPDGTLDYKYAGLPTSAKLDLKDDLEIKLGLAQPRSDEEEAARGKLAYQPRNNALLFFRMGKRYEEKGHPQKAKAKYIEALQKDADYADPLRSLEGIFFADGRTPEAVERLKNLLTASGLEGVVEKIQDEPVGEENAEAPAQAAAPQGEKKLTPMERMKLLMEKGKRQE